MPINVVSQVLNLINEIGYPVDISTRAASGSVDSYGDPDVAYVTTTITCYIASKPIHDEDWREEGNLPENSRYGYVSAEVTVTERDLLTVGSVNYEVRAVRPVWLGSIVQFYRLLLKESSQRI